MIQLLENLDDRYNPKLYIIASKDRISEEKVLTFEKTRATGTYTIATIPRSREVHQSYVSSIITTLYSFYYAVKIVWKTKPDLVLVNGPGTCIPVVIAAAVLDMIRLRDTTIIYEESICRVERLSLSGALLYYSGLADDIIVQWPNLKDKYPRATLVHDIEE
uniref:UDP-N-acetylglucosamine transferase subunit ALG14 n=1 Tax=Heterorhabditis bacteriophora TaxID=37862 RepID=A0A1I7XKZ6_HETBA